MDGLDFTRQLAFDLEFYMDVFWDKRLKAGDYPKQLEQEIEQRDYLLLVMTPYSINSDWCKRELAHAEAHGKDIVLARIFTGDGTTDPVLVKKYTYGDFTEDFEVGFRSITAQTLGNPYSSWEVFYNLPDGQLLETLKNGYLPSLIAKELVEWAIVERLWIAPSNQADKTQLIFRASPRTPYGILRMSSVLVEYFGRERDALGAHLTKNVLDLVKPALEELSQLEEHEHTKIGQLSHQIIQDIKQILNKNAVGFRDAREAWIVLHYFDFDVAEKIRELINLHARRSRYLY
jgi:hypothetical protein